MAGPGYGRHFQIKLVEYIGVDFLCTIIQEIFPKHVLFVSVIDALQVFVNDQHIILICMKMWIAFSYVCST